MNKFLKGAMILTIAGIIVKIIGAVSKILISRLLGGEGIGLFQMAYPIYTLATSVAAAGMPVAISIMIAERLANRDIRGAERTFRVALIALALTGVLFSGLFYLSADWLIQRHFVLDERAYYGIIALSPAILVVTLLSCFRGYFQGFQYMVPTGVSQIFEQSFRVIAMVAFAVWLLPKGLEFAAAGAALGTLPGVLAALAVLIFFYFRQSRVRAAYALEQDETILPDSAGRIIRRLLILAIPVSMANIMLPIVSTIDLFIVPHRLVAAGFQVDEATELFGYLTGMATSLVNLPTILTASLAASLVPAVSEAYALKNTTQILDRTRMAMKIANLITIPAFIGMCVLATPISAMLYATPNAGGPIAVMSLGIFLLGVQQVTTGILQGLGHTALPMINLVASAVLKVIFSWYLTAVPALGINGAAWATNIDFGMAAVLNLYFVYRYVGYRIDWWEWSKITLSAMAMGGTTAVLYYFAVPFTGNTGAVILGIAAAIAVYTLALVVTKAVEEKDLYVLPVIGKKLAARRKESRRGE